MSGTGTNIGIDYQQRISSLILLYMYAEYDLDTIFQIGSSLNAQEIFYESNEEIDDLVIKCEKSTKCYLQIKKRINLSEDKESDFYGTLKQFVSQFLHLTSSDEYYFLVTSTESSKKIRKDLKKVLEGCRLNNSFNLNTLNQSEKSTFEKFKGIVTGIYKLLKDEEISDEKFISLSKKIFIVEADIYNNSTYEKSALLLLALKFNNPELIWSLLVKNSLSYASNKQSITKEKIQEILNNFVINSSSIDSETKEIEAALNIVVIENELAAGKDVIITDSFLPEFNADIFLIELFRFDDDCTKRLKYNNEKVLFKDGREYKVLFRSATVIGAMRFLEQNKEVFKDKEVCHITTKALENVEKNQCVDIHRKNLEVLFNNNKYKRNCLHCQNTITDIDSVVIEVDNLYQESNVGLVHLKCLLPIDRVIGSIKIPNKSIELPNINIHLWIKLLLKGQGQLNQLKESKINRPILFIGWNPEKINKFNYSYCIKCILEDDSTVFVYRRGKIERFNYEDVKEKLNYFNEKIEKANLERDPWCFTSKDLTFGRYSLLLQNKNEDDNILKIKDVSISKYSELDAKVFNRDIYYYAPLCLLTNKEGSEIINLKDIIPLISDPFSYSSIVQNWKDSGIVLPEIQLKIIENDDEFDNLIASFIKNNFTPVIDPMFDMKGELSKGYIIFDINSLPANRTP